MTKDIAPPNKKNIQGLILRGYGHPYSAHMLFGFTNPERVSPVDTKAFFKTLYPLVRSAEEWGQNRPQQMLNIGLTYNGIQALNVLKSQGALAAFPSEFQNGPWSPDSQISLGDKGDGAYGKWWWGNFRNEELHCVVHAYGLTQSDLSQLISKVTDSARSNGLRELFGLKGNQERLTQYQLPKDEIHFGFRDGISEPALKWGEATADQSDLNNFLIGYYPDDSIIQPGPSSPSAGEAASFAKDGCYNAFRVLYQDVAAFNRFVEQQAAAWAKTIGRSPEQAQEWVAAKLMGRWRNGSPLILSPEEPSADTKDAEVFSYVEQTDKSPYKDIDSGYKCPFSAHVRVANPRDEDLTPAEGASGAPRIIRRGVPYGKPLESSTDDGVDRGLIGLFLCGSLAQQFEKVYSWMNTNNFSRVFSFRGYPQDAVVGNRQTRNTVNSFIIPRRENDIPPVQNLPLFIVTRGTAYCLVPSLESLRLIAGL
jgi:deferrochelatase/peroxidase EfeB